MHDTILVIELCRTIKTFKNFTGVFSKLAYSFVAIKLLAFFINKKSIFIAQESSQYLGFKKNPYVNRIDFFAFVYMKTFRKKQLYEQKLQLLPSAKDNLHVFIYCLVDVDSSIFSTYSTPPPL